MCFICLWKWCIKPLLLPFFLVRIFQNFAPVADLHLHTVERRVSLLAGMVEVALGKQP